MLRAILYARVSDKAAQGDNFSIESQLAAMRKYTETQGWYVMREFEEKQSAFHDGLDRPKLKEVLELARRSAFDVLIAFSADRFTRDIGDGVVLRRQLQRSGIKLFFVHPSPREVGSEHEIINIIMDLQSQSYVERSQEACARGRRTKAESGIFPHGKIHYGYAIEGRGRNALVVIREPYASHVRQIFQWCVEEHLTCPQIAARLTQMGVPTRSEVSGRKVRRFRKAGEWTEQVVRSLLKTEAYTGIYNAMGWSRKARGKAIYQPERTTPITIPALVDHETWELAQQEMSIKRSKAKRKYDYLMAHRLRCACGYGMRGNSSMHSGKICASYRCLSYRSHTGPCSIGTPAVSLIDGRVWDFARNLLSDPARILRNYQEAQAQLNTEHESLRQAIEALEERITAGRADLVSLMDSRQAARTKPAQEMYDQRIDLIGTELEELEKKRSQLIERMEEKTLTDDEIERVVSAVDAIREELADIDQTNDFATKRRLIEALNLTAIVRRHEDGTKWLDIKWLLTTHSRQLGSSAHTMGSMSGRSASSGGSAGLAPRSPLPPRRRVLLDHGFAGLRTPHPRQRPGAGPLDSRAGTGRPGPC